MSKTMTEEQRRLFELFDPEDTWTEEQKQSITMLDGNVIVSASAGCGKTKAMVERAYILIRDRVPVTNLTLLTFTEAAAAEMKEKLRKRLTKAAKNEKDSKMKEYLVEQIDNMPYANISTIHGFCYALVREYFAQRPLSPTVKIIEEDAADELKRKAFEQLLKEKEDDADFNEMRFTIGLRDDKDLFEILGEIYDRMTNQPEREHWLNRVYDEMYGATFETSVMATYFKDKISAAVHELTVEAQALKEEAVGDVKYDKVLILCNRLACYEGKNTVEQLMNAYVQSCDGETMRLDKSNYADRIRMLNLKYNVYVRDKVKEICSLGTYARIVEMHRESAPLIRQLFDAVIDFQRQYTLQKQEAGCVDFSDLERYAMQILRDPDVRQEVRARNQYVFVDEFQDTNLVQSTIIAQITPEERLYVVGDSKQCIYRFREAEPQIFLDRLAALKETNQDVTYSDNFRSDNCILDFVNRTFDHLMTAKFGGVDYQKTERFKLRPEKAHSTNAVAHYFYDKTPKDKAPVSGLYSVKNAKPAVDDKDRSEGVAIANFIADHLGEKIVEEKVNGETTLRGLRYGDVAILVAKRKAAERIVATLNELDVPLNLDTFAGDTGLRDVNVLLALADLMDNGMQDYPLLTVLKSAFGGFGNAELAEIRMSGDKYIPFWQVFARFAEGDSDLAKRAARFLKDVETTAFEASFTPLATLFRRCIVKWGYADYLYAQEDGLERMAALQYFISSLEGKSYAVDLASLCAHFHAFPVEELASVSVDSSTDRVIVSTMHASKGLEYPMVILPALDSSKGGKKADVVLDKVLGIGTEYFDPKKRAKCTTFAKTVIKMKKEDEEREDRLRLLYVAMTRAKNYLMLSGAKKEDPATIADTTGNFVDWMLIAMSADKSLNDFAYTDTAIRKKQDKKDNRKGISASELKDVMGFDYQYKEATLLEKKYTVTALNARQSSNEVPVPTFVGDEEEKKEGTLYHTVFQHINYNVNRSEDVSAELAVLVSDGILTEEERAKVDDSIVWNCLRLPVLRRTLDGAVKSYHELRFVMREDAPKLRLPSQEKVLVQGIIDLLLVEDDGLTVIDFKMSSRSPEALRKAYAMQLQLYANAARIAYGKPVKECLLVKIPDAEVVKVNVAQGV